MDMDICYFRRNVSWELRNGHVVRKLTDEIILYNKYKFAFL